MTDATEIFGPYPPGYAVAPAVLNSDDGAVEAPCPEGDVECEDAKMTLENVEEMDLSKYYETLSLGVIDGFVSSFNANC